MITRRSPLAVVVVGAVVASALAAVVPFASIAAQADQRFEIGRTGLVDINVRNGLVIVRGEDRSDGEFRTNGDRYELKTTGAGVAVSPRAGRVSSSSRRVDSDDERIELTVPRGVRVSISGGLADVDVRDITGEVEVRTRTGDVSLLRLGERLIVETLSGDVTLDGGVGTARIVTSSGDMRLHGIRSEVDIRTTSGDVEMTGERLSIVGFQSISGDFVLDGGLADNVRLRAATHSGDVALSIGSGLRGSLEFETHNGELTATSAMLMTGPRAPASGRSARQTQRFEFNGGGSASLSVSTFNGDLRFDRNGRR